MFALTFKCTSCGAYISFQPGEQNFACEYCGAKYDTDELIQKLEEDSTIETTSASSPNAEQEMVYNCKNCGAEIVAQGTTAATHCYYCQSPVVLTDKLSAEYKPDRVIPFQFDKKQAQEHFLNFIKTKKFVPKEFFNQSQLEKLSGVYYPYWDCDYDVDAEFQGEATEVSSYISGNYRITTTNYYDVYRKGKIRFNNIFRSALQKNQKELADGIHPFEETDEKPYSPAYLAGFMAERRDIDSNDIAPEVENEIEQYIEPLLTQDSNYSSISGNSQYNILNKSFNYLLLPTWVLTYLGPDGKRYYYSMNGQTGKTCGKLPIDKTKLLISSLGTGTILAILALLGGLFIW